uniref:Uncharacterized protein n=1 Tax=Schistocephalus solidus TaxID=70667 RepID=A0A0X3NTL4_SCHSO
MNHARKEQRLSPDNLMLCKGAPCGGSSRRLSRMGGLTRLNASVTRSNALNFSRGTLPRSPLLRNLMRAKTSKHLPKNAQGHPGGLHQSNLGNPKEICESTGFECLLRSSNYGRLCIRVYFLLSILYQPIHGGCCFFGEIRATLAVLHFTDHNSAEVFVVSLPAHRRSETVKSHNIFRPRLAFWQTFTLHFCHFIMNKFPKFYFE